MTHGDPVMQQLPTRELAYWDRLEIPEVKDLPVPTAPLVLAYRGVILLKESHAAGPTVTKADIEKAEDDMRMMEAAHCQTFKPDYAPDYT
jgi:hypothetical protein